MAKIGVVLSGCGVFDGSEIHETVCALVALDDAGAEVQCMAPRRTFRVVDHVTGQETGEERDVFTESARIARGNIIDVADVDVHDYDAFVFPGGFGAAKNLCTFAVDGPACSIDPGVDRLLGAAHEAERPIGLICIAPAVGAKALGSKVPSLTIGSDEATAKGLEALGARHNVRAVDAIEVDTENRIVSTPAYMEAKSIGQVRDGITKLVNEVVRMAREPAAVG